MGTQERCSSTCGSTADSKTNHLQKHNAWKTGNTPSWKVTENQGKPLHSCYAYHEACPCLGGTEGTILQPCRSWEVFWMNGSTTQTNFHTSQTFPPAVIVSPTSIEAGYWCDKWGTEQYHTTLTCLQPFTLQRSTDKHYIQDSGFLADAFIIIKPSTWYTYVIFHVCSL